VGRASLPFLNHCSAVFPDPCVHGQPLRPGSQLAVVSQGRHAAPAVSPTAFNEVLLGFLKNK